MRIFLSEGNMNPGVVNALAWNFRKYGHEVHGAPATDYMKRIGCKEAQACNYDSENDLFVGVHLDSALRLRNDKMRKAGYRVIGASKFFAEAEKAKNFGQHLLKELGYKLPETYEFGNVDTAIEFVKDKKRPFVVKVDDSSDPMGVIIPKDWRDTIWILQNERTIQQKRIVLQELLHGTEVGFGGFFNGETVDLMAITFEHKRVFAGDQGPNCAEMGTSFLPVELVEKEKLADLIFGPLYPVLQHTQYRGFIDLNGMITGDIEWKVLEFTCRFGSPQTEIMIWYIEDDLAEYLWKVANGEKAELKIRSDLYFVGVTKVCAGYPYPDACRIGSPVYGNIEWIYVIPMSVKYDQENGFYRTAGGRIATFTGLGYSMEDAVSDAYGKASMVDFLDSYMRLDIGAYGWNKKRNDVIQWLGCYDMLREI
ncbi:hypothetical protein EH221_03940 [bacterium]|nr:MAG: hypothetical protein EH221_03940 [bacterium]